MAKKSSLNQVLKSFIEYQKKNDFLYIANSISKLLQINCPPIHFVDCFYEYNGTPYFQEVLDMHTLPLDASFPSGFLSDTDEIYVAQKNPIYASSNFVSRFEPKTNSEIIFVLAHELRHAWQKKYDPDRYYQYNARGREVYHDISEIDADAFALLLIFSDQIDIDPIQPDNLTYAFNFIFALTYLDDGKRWTRVKELSNEFSWGNWGRVEDFESKLSYKKIRDDIKIQGEKHG